MSDTAQQNAPTRVAIIGIGVIGGSLAMAIKRKLPTLEVLAVDEEPIVALGRELGAIDRGFGKEEVEGCVAQADVVVLATPIAEILRLLPRVAAAVRPGAIITDVGSSKRKIVQVAEAVVPSGCYFVGGHPMAGSERQGLRAADPLLFENAVWVLTPAAKTPARVVRSLGGLLEQVGAKVLIVSPLLHDRVAAAVSHLPQLLAVALMNMVARHQSDMPHLLKLAAGGFRDMTRIASSPYRMWADVLATNVEQIVPFVDEYIAELERIRGKLLAGDLAVEFDSAARSRLFIPRDTKGFLKPHYDLIVQVEDRPGVIAAMAGALAAEEINIKDIEVLKVREGEAGSIRMAFESEACRKRAAELIGSLGYRVRTVE
ncbi:MAG: prephenate dehydrogenase/arogenate dehydrogenase family protein [Calditrichaeota bacterium]|nr:prephenate dehydrogenase/arogenate dehydrogenase family protein [Calditrichota bacterium]